jgi:hypothetical protein
MHTIRQWSRTPECDPKKFPTELKNTKIENFFGSHFGVRLHWRKMFLGSRFPWEIFIERRSRVHVEVWAHGETAGHTEAKHGGNGRK